MNSKGYFITGTDTGVGKTVVSAIVAKKIKASYYKPIQCGLNEEGLKDSDVVKSFFGDINIIKETYLFAKPLSPNIASKLEGIEIDVSKFSKIENLTEPLVIEGAGGLQVPINKDLLVSDLIGMFDLPTILVCRTQLGTINHTLMSIEIIKKKEINFKGLIFTGNQNSDSINTILNFGEKIYGSKIKLLGRIPFIKPLNGDNLKKLNIKV